MELAFNGVPRSFNLIDQSTIFSLVPVKMFKLSEVESLAVKKWGSMEKLQAEQETRKQKNSELESRTEEEKRHFWDCEEIFEPLKTFMEKIELPVERISSYFKEKANNTQGDVNIKEY